MMKEENLIKTNISVLFGSETGNSESIASRINDVITKTISDIKANYLS